MKKEIVLLCVMLLGSFNLCAQTDYKMAGPYEVVARDGQYASTKGGSERDMWTAWQCAKFGDTNKALEIINAYASKWSAMIRRAMLPVLDKFEANSPYANGWWRLTNDAGRGIEISGSQPLSMSARPLDRYMVHAQDMEYTFRIIPIRKSLIKHQ